MIASIFAALLAAAGATVIQPVASLHSRPEAQSDVVSQAIFGSHARLLEVRHGWAKVKSEDNYEGWMETAALRLLGGGEKPYASPGRAVVVESLFANLYREPDLTKHKPLLTLPFEARLEVVAESTREEDRWLEVRLPDGRRAWVQQGDVRAGGAPLGVGEVIALAKRFLGLPYLWGGTSSYGFDCSGFTQMLVRRRGVIMPRDAAPQARWEGSFAIDRFQLQPGDLLYFGDSEEKITHTGMYIGSGEFIHATTNGRPVVQISRLAEEPWTTLLKKCRRLK